MHCFKCGAKGFDYARVAPLSRGSRSAERTKVPLSPRPISFRTDNEILLSYGLSWVDARPGLFYDEQARRLCFPLSAIDSKPGNPASHAMGVGYVGKSLDQKPKWYLSDSSKYVPDDRAYFYHAPSNSGAANLCVLTEDPISALKISYSDPKACGIAMLGLSMPPGLLEYLGNSNKALTLVVWPDGDNAGIVRGTKIYKQIKFIRPNTQLVYVLNMDPKDLHPTQIGERLARIREEAGRES